MVRKSRSGNVRGLPNGCDLSASSDFDVLRHQGNTFVERGYPNQAVTGVARIAWRKLVGENCDSAVCRRPCVASRANSQGYSAPAPKSRSTIPVDAQ